MKIKLQYALANRVMVKQGGEILLMLWCSSLGVLSYLMLPSIQGTVPAYLFGLASIPFCLFWFRFRDVLCLWDYLRDGVIALLVYLLFLVTSQLNHYLSGVSYVEGFLYISSGAGMVLRMSLFTQSLYLAACVGVFLFFRHWPGASKCNCVFLAAWFVAIYGIYEWLYYCFTGISGDFIVNRTFDEHHTGSWVQGVTVAGVGMMRIKSTLGEPSFFSAVGVPFLFLAYLQKRWVLAALLLFCVVFTWSSSAYGGVFVGLLVLAITDRGNRGRATLLLLFGMLVGAGIFLALPDLYDSMVTAKLGGYNDSGAIRMDLAEASKEAWGKLNIIHRLFGIGFGYTYASVAKALLLNVGVLGLAVFAVLFCYPLLVHFVKGRFDSWALALFVIFALYAINVAELFLPTTWAIMGLAWHRVDEEEGKVNA